MYSCIKFEVKDQIATLTLNRPDVYNALNRDILIELQEAFKVIAADENVRCVVLTGGACKAFSSGADLKSGITDPNLGKVLAETYNPLIKLMTSLPKPIICHLNGLAAGAGMSLALACDLIIADKEAYFSELFVGIGLMPDAGSMYFLPRLIGVQKTFELCATGRKVFMEEAKEMGLINNFYEGNELLVKVNEMSHTLSTAATFSIGQMKKVLHSSLNSSLDEVLNLESEGQTACGFSGDFIEGVTSFLQKRKPDFKGK